MSCKLQALVCVHTAFCGEWGGAAAQSTHSPPCPCVVCCYLWTAVSCCGPRLQLAKDGVSEENGLQAHFINKLQGVVSVPTPSPCEHPLSTQRQGPCIMKYEIRPCPCPTPRLARALLVAIALALCPSCTWCPCPCPCRRGCCPSCPWPCPCAYCYPYPCPRGRCSC